MKKVRYGILSTAQVARKSHIPAILKSSNSKVAAICSRDIEKAEKYANEFGIGKAYKSYEELLRDPDIDAIINTLPNSMHCEWTIKAAQAGKHVLCEKPFAVTVEEASQMIEAAKKNNVLVMEAFTHRFKPEVEFVRDFISSGRLGTVKAVYSNLVYPLGDPENDTRIKKELGGGSLLDCGCYNVSLIRYVLGKDPVSVHGFRKMSETNDVDTSFCGSLLFSDSCMAVFFSNQNLPFRASIEVMGEYGRISLDNYFTGNTVDYIINKEKKQQTFEKTDRFILQIEHFSECILQNKMPRFLPEDAARNTSVLVALGKAAETGRSVFVEYL